MTKREEEKLELIVNTILRLEANSADVVESVNKALQLHSTLKYELEVVSRHQYELEAELAAVVGRPTTANHFAPL